VDLPFDLAVYDRDLKFQQALTDPVEVVFSPSWTLGTAEITVSADDPILPFMQADGARLVARYKGEHLISGWLYESEGTIEPGGDVRFGLYADEYLSAWTAGWVVPSGTLQPTSLTDLGQAAPGPNGHTAGLGDGLPFYAWASDVSTSETAIKRVLSENFARFPAGDLRRRTVITPDLGRGGNARTAGMLPQIRMDALDEALLPLREWASLGLRIWQAPRATTLSLDVYAPKTWPLALTVESGTVTDGTYKVTGPTATRGVLGGPGDDAERAYGSFVDTAAETRLGFGIETFVDAASGTLVWPSSLDDGYRVPKYFLTRTEVDANAKADFRAYLSAAASKAMSEQAATSSASVSLSETPSFTYGGSAGYHVGDLITIGTASVDVQERITGVTLTFNSEGFSVVPTLGLGSTDDEQTQAVTDLARSVRALALAARRRATRQ
jgi:hypothetical protein